MLTSRNSKMLDNFLKKKRIVFCIIIFAILLYLPALNNFFSADDWFHLRISRITSFAELVNFFSFVPNSQTASFYRPLSTQLFFFTFYTLFGLTARAYYLFGLVLLSAILYQINTTARLLRLSDFVRTLTVLLYGVSATNFTRLYFLSAYQELFMVFFSLMCINSYLENKKYRATIFFVLALLSKETAVVLPLILLAVDWYKRKIHIKKYIPYLIILLSYLYLRLHIFGVATGDTYIWNFSIKTMFNTLMWYTLWSLGAPELLVDYIGSGLVPITRFYSDYPFFAYYILSVTLFLVGTSIYMFSKSLHQRLRRLALFSTIFVLPLLPVIFLPYHKFTLELGLPLVGFSLLIATLSSQKNKLALTHISVFILFNITMNFLTYTRHYTVSRSTLARNIYEYVIKNNTTYPINKPLRFIDPDLTGPYEDYSNQISLATSRSDMFQVIYNDPDIVVYFDKMTTLADEMVTTDIYSKDFFAK